MMRPLALNCSVCFHIVPSLRNLPSSPYHWDLTGAVIALRHVGITDSNVSVTSDVYFPNRSSYTLPTEVWAELLEGASDDSDS